MISELVDPEILRIVLLQFEANLARELVHLREGDSKAKEGADAAGLSETEARATQERVKEAKASEAEELATGNAPVAIPRNAVASLIQSAYEEFFLAAGAVIRAPEVQHAAPTLVPAADLSLDAEASDFLLGTPDYLAGRFATRFAERDARFLTWGAAAKVATWWRGRRAFTNAPPPPLKIANQARVLLVGDWGTGVRRAQQVAAVMRASVEDALIRQLECHVIHLGDVYYTGQASEYDRRFLTYWPVDDAPEMKHVGSWCLNGNYDMYSGGEGYFDHMLKDPRFHRQQQSSFFSLENDHWQILGLDSAYEDADLYGPQAEWVQRTRFASSKKGVLLTHHQPFSAWEKTSMALQSKLRPVLDAGRVDAWFWGHEHRCAAYDARKEVKYGRLIGHGGVPVWAAKGPTPPGVHYEYTGSFPAYVNEEFARFGFARLDFDDGRIQVAYINELGKTHYNEPIE